jgi:hypothetical protein
LPFTPSATLKAILFFAIKAAMEPVENFMPFPVANQPPTNFFFGRKVFDWKPSETSLAMEAERKAESEKIDRLVAEQKENIARRQKNELAANSATHAATTAKLSELHDKLRVECQADADKADAERQARRPVQNVRIVQ